MRRRLGIAVVLGSGLAVLAGVGLAAVDTSEFVGAGRCLQCHPTAHKAWQGSPHARAHLALSGKQVADPRCTQCHGTAERDLAGVQCESCHGPGRYYAQRHVMKDAVLSRIVGLRDVTEEACRGCHTDAA
ncbi:MAG TPA: multiheme c-type cytochrome, partial [Myxococcota bacterium]|nr:multiheme c-type cytochrome [Myxococcota bacterium]